LLFFQNASVILLMIDLQKEAIGADYPNLA